MRIICIVAVVCAAAVAGGGPAAAGQTVGSGDRWLGTWATATVPRPQTPAQGNQPAPLNFSNQTLRQIVHTSIGGSRVRVVVSNVFGTTPLMIGAAHVALRQKNEAIVP